MEGKVQIWIKKHPSLDTNEGKFKLPGKYKIKNILWLFIMFWNVYIRNNIRVISDLISLQIPLSLNIKLQANCNTWMQEKSGNRKYFIPLLRLTDN